MATEVQVTPNRTYATRKNLETAINKFPVFRDAPNLRYLVMTTEDGRFYPLFLGETAVQIGVHHAHFCVAG